MSEWVVEVSSMIPQGQVAEFLMIARVDHVTGECEIMQANMLKTFGGAYPIPDSGSPLTAVGSAASDGRGINALLQAIMDCAWKRGLRPSKFDPSAGELAAVKAHLEDIRRIGMKFSKTVEDVISDIGTDEKKIW